MANLLFATRESDSLRSENPKMSQPSCGLVLCSGVIAEQRLRQRAASLGASSCSIGRAFLWGLCAGGQEGVRKTITILRDELDNAMTLLGTVPIEDVPAGHVRPRYKGAA